MPVRHVRLRQHRLSHRQLLDRVALFLPAPASVLDQQDLRGSMEMPVGARARLEADPRHVRPLRGLYRDRAGEIGREVPTRSAGGAGALTALRILLRRPGDGRDEEKSRSERQPAADRPWTCCHDDLLYAVSLRLNTRRPREMKTTSPNSCARYPRATACPVISCNTV